jgi:tRNA pseudouridine55 synthase
MTPRDGLLIVDKPAGPTSHDIVAAVRRWAAGLRVGHTGTLDPFATGVLPLCLGKATRLARFLTASRKVYAGSVRLGIATDTYDPEGQVTFEGVLDGITEQTLRAAVAEFLGTSLQTPPPYSARKLAGLPSYRLAREGKVVSLPPTEVTVHRFEITQVRLPHFDFTIETSPGTYVRSIAHDLGGRLRCGGHLAALRRLAVGSYGAQHAHTLATIEGMAREGGLDSLIAPLRAIDIGMPSVTVTPAGETAMGHGRDLTTVDLTGPPPLGTKTVRVQNQAGELLGVAVPAETPGLLGILRPSVVLMG